MRSLPLLACAVMVAVSIGCQKEQARTSMSLPEPSVVTQNDGITHEIYRDMSFEEFTPGIPSGSIDSIDFDTTFGDYAIALVTAPRDADDESAQFTTTFLSESRGEVVKTWRVAAGNTGGSVRGLFSVPHDVASATTVRHRPETHVDGGMGDHDSARDTSRGRRIMSDQNPTPDGT